MNIQPFIIWKLRNLLPKLDSPRMGWVWEITHIDVDLLQRSSRNWCSGVYLRTYIYSRKEVSDSFSLQIN